ncbi:MAG: phytanoyl-CoA dioxygenase family protein [Gammaproteobacteria bacterium]|nr:phytanoyl-CoA dioxygenase family protein [Gammaproteobacteria bacterium]
MTTTTIATHDSSEPAEAVVATLRRDGAVVVANLVAPEDMDQLTADLKFGDETKAGNDFIGGSDNRSIGAVLHANPELCETLLVNERVLEVADSILRPEKPMAASSQPVKREKTRLATSDDGCAQYLSVAAPPESGPYCHHYRVGASVSIEARTGGAVQVLHREMAIYEPYVAHGPSTRDYILNMMWAGSDFTIANGATRLVPGSHLWPADRVANESEVAQAVMPKGSVLFWLCRTLHGLGACNSKTSRTGIFHSLVVNWLAQEENQYLAFPPEAASRLSLKARQLLGYRSSGTCGWVKGRDSYDLLASGASGPLE